MLAGRSAEILRHLEVPAIPDRELISRFVRERDQSAFAELVRRHGTVVLAVCKRVTGHQQDAEDAFQAVFMMLARKAATIGNPDLLGNWLYGVAVRIAQTARRSAMRRRGREVVVSAMPDQAAIQNEAIVELNPILDEELTALPSWYREAIVLCDLRGVPREEAARCLGVPEGTLSSRLANGRKKLAARLTKRGIALSAAAIPTTLSTMQAVTVPAELVAKTCNLIAHWASGGTVPKPFAKLSEGGMTMRKFLVLGLLTTALAIGGVVYATHSPENPCPSDPPKAPPTAGKSEVAEQPVPDVKLDDNRASYSRTPKLRDIVDINVHGIQEMSWNKQGDRVAIVGRRLFSSVPKNNQPDRSNIAENTGMGCVFVIGVSPLAPPKITNYATFYLNNNQKDKFVGFTQDGKYLLTEHREYQLLSGVHKLNFWGNEGEEFGSPVRPLNAINPRPLVMNAWLTEKLSIDLETAETQGYYFAADRKNIRTIAIERDATTKKVTKLQVLEIDAVTGNRLKSLLTVEGDTYAMSSDGKRLAVLGQENTNVLSDADGNRLEILNHEKTVVMYDVDRATKMFSYKLASQVKKSDAPPAFAYFSANPSAQETSWMGFSPDGHRLFVTCGVGELVNLQFQRPKDSNLQWMIVSGGHGQCVVLNADTGDRLPPLEGAECLGCLPERNAFSSDGRLIALAGTSFTISKQKLIMVSNITLQKEKSANKEIEQIVLESAKKFLTVWDTQTGKVVKSWEMSPVVAFNPVRPVLAILEPNDGDTRLGLWDFSSELTEKK